MQRQASGFGLVKIFIEVEIKLLEKGGRGWSYQQMQAWLASCMCNLFGISLQADGGDVMFLRNGLVCL